MLLQKREKIIALVLAISVSLLLVDRFVLSPLIRTWRADGEKWFELRSEKVTADSLLRNREVWNDWLNAASAQALPQRRDAAEQKILGQLVEIGNKSRVASPSLSPRNFNRDGLNLLSVQISTSGNMRSISEFLYMVETMPGPFKLESSRITSRDERGGQISLEMTLVALLESERGEK